MDTMTLIHMMFDSKPIEEFEELWKLGTQGCDWGDLLHMCYCEESYESVGGDEGYKPNPPINHERLEYLSKLIALLESYGIEETK